MSLSEPMHIPAENIVHAVNIANDLRTAFGEPLLNDLPQSKPGHPLKCVLARAFNFHCGVRPRYENDEEGYKRMGWEVIFQVSEKAQGQKLAELLETELEENHSEEYIYYTVALPQEIGDIARAFDDFWLDPKYYIDGTYVDRMAVRNASENSK